MKSVKSRTKTLIIDWYLLGGVGCWWIVGCCWGEMIIMITNTDSYDEGKYPNRWECFYNGKKKERK